MYLYPTYILLLLLPGTTRCDLATYSCLKSSTGSPASSFGVRISGPASDCLKLLPTLSELRVHGTAKGMNSQVHCRHYTSSQGLSPIYFGSPIVFGPLLTFSPTHAIIQPVHRLRCYSISGSSSDLNLALLLSITAIEVLYPSP
jgi:hypothetical protein